MRRHSSAVDPRPWAVALVRWSIGLLLLIFGIGKLARVSFFVENYVFAPLQPTGLPKWLLILCGYAMPPLEMALGVLLLLGLARNHVLFITGLYLLLLLLGQSVFTLGYGQLMLVQPPLVFSNLIFICVTAALLFLHEHDHWILGQRKDTPAADQDKELESLPS